MDTAKKIIDEILAGNSKAFERLVIDYQRLVNHIVYKMLPDKGEVEDICQEVFVKAYRSLSTFRGEAKFSTWIGKIAYNSCIDYLGKKKLARIEEDFNDTAKYIPDENPTPDNLIGRDELGGILRTEIDLLPPQLGTILALYHLEEMSYIEISDILAMPEGTVKSYLFRGRKLLKERLMSKYNIEELWQ